MMNRRAPILALAVLAIAGASACSSSNTVDDSAKSLDCLTVPQPVVERITMPSMAASVPITISKAKAVKATDNYYIAAKFTAPGASPDTGVWATSSLEGAGAMIYGTEGFSHQFTRWPKAPGIDGENQFVKSAKACLDK